MASNITRSVRGATFSLRHQVVEDLAETWKMHQKRLEIFAIDGKDVHFADSPDRGIARGIVEECHLAETFAGAKSRDGFRAATGLLNDFDLALDDEINTVTVIAFSKNDLA